MLFLLLKCSQSVSEEYNNWTDSITTFFGAGLHGGGSIDTGLLRLQNCSMIIRLIIFAVGTLGVVFISLHSASKLRSYGFLRFFAFESIHKSMFITAIDDPDKSRRVVTSQED